MFGIGWTEFIVVALVLLIFVGPKHMPEMLRKIGSIIGELRSASRELRSQIEVEMEDLKPPSEIVRDLGRELIDDLPSPYQELERTKNAVKKEFRDVEDEVYGRNEKTEAANDDQSAPNDRQEDKEKL